MGRPKKGPREKDLTSRYMSGALDEDRVESEERFSPNTKARQQDKIVRTALMRAGEESGADIQTLPIGHVVQVHSRFSDVEHEGKTYLCEVRKTLRRISETQVVVGDKVRFREAALDEGQIARRASGAAIIRGDMQTAIIEQVLPRETILLRADSFKAIEQHPIVANAKQMLIVASLRFPNVKWGLIDRMLIAAQSGGLKPILSINKIDLIDAAEASEDRVDPRAAMAHYQSMGVTLLSTSAINRVGLDELRTTLTGTETVLAGHSGVGKSSLINSIQPQLDLRIGEISRFNDKGRHTTTSARRYPLDFGGAVIDTPGVKLFGLWGVTSENLLEYFPDVAAGNAPTWRAESYERIAASLG